MGDVRIPVGSDELPVFVTVPEEGAPWPGVVVLHDVAGMSEDLRNQTRWLAKAGSPGSRAELAFSRRKDEMSFRRRARPQGEARSDVRRRGSCPHRLIKHPECTGKIGVIGFCMGGGFALLLAPDHGFGAASVNYGGKLPPDAEPSLRRHARSSRAMEPRTAGPAAWRSSLSMRSWRQISRTT